MGHLGNSTPITTVQDKEIVLTGSDGHTFKMKIADLAEAVRQVMPVATSKKNGLMGEDGFFSSSSLCPDANDAINSGTYFTSSTSTNLAVKTWGTLVVFKSYYTVQIQITAASNPSLFSRIRIDKEWSAWISISIT